MEKLSFPNRVTIELTNDCNVSCIFCNRQKIKMDIGYMDKELYQKIIDEMSEHKPIKMVPFFRGEPLMHPHIIDFIKYAKSKGIGPIQMASNALLLDEKMQDELIESGIDYISFSLDTLDEDVYSCSRLMGDLLISSKNVEEFGMKCKKRREEGKETPTIQVSTINIKEYMPRQQEFIEKWKKYVDVVRVYEQHDENGRLVDPNVCKQINIMGTRKPCRKIFTDMIIYWDGRLALCNYDWDEKKELGNICQITMEEAWNSDEYEKIRDMHLTDEIDDCICKECHHWKIDYTEKGYIGTSYRGE